MDLQDLKGKLVAVLGYGQEGKAVTAYLIKHGIKPVLFDQKPWEDWSEIEKSEIKKLGVNFIFGPDCFKELKGFDVVFRSPGVRTSHLAPHTSHLTSQTKWFFEHCPCKIIGVTGTKGKGTTASLIYEILEARTSHLAPRTYLTGNIGKIQPLEILDELKPDDYVVYELSSFQLQDLTQSPHIAVVLMVTSEHLDYHADQKEYVDAKSAITKFQTADDFAVINADFENSVKIGELGKGQKIYFSRQKILETGCFIKNGQIILNIPGFHQGASSDLGNSQTEDAPWSQNGNFQFPISDFQLRGAHNLENVCAAVSVGKILGIQDDIIGKAVIGFKGLEHRLEFVAEKNGVKFYNDSFSTTPETAIAAIESFAEPEILILGGSSKNSDFTELGKIITAKKNIKAVILIGQEAGKIKLAIKTPTPNPSPRGRGETLAILEGAKNMAEIFGQIKSVAVPGDIVLFTPACASFDMFKSYVDRGNQFKEAVKKF
jgi:UDP-N-acetylmuramoylalanine--D-glutamate ligase